MKLVLTVVERNEVKGGTAEGDIICKFDVTLVDPLEGNLASGEVFLSAPRKNAQFNYGDKIEADLSLKEDTIEVVLD